MSSSDTYEIYALRYGYLDRSRQSNFRDPIDNPDDEMSMDYYVWAIRNDERTIVVDTGFDHGEARRRGRTVERLPSVALDALGINASLPTIMCTAYMQKPLAVVANTIQPL